MRPNDISLDEHEAAYLATIAAGAIVVAASLTIGLLALATQRITSRPTRA